ncbi:MAG: CusA/CzcA family heavy metal efflux RND transporter [Candidatus Aminicenantes bacterium]|nr:CusA/CzcA family heavy metal efflux RND transporter [Candidatus Aminicenantes bacterium]
MLERIISASLKRRALIVVLLVLIVGVGIYSLLNLHMDAFPDVTNIQVEIVSRAPGLSPLEIEKFVTYPIEMTMRGLPGLVQMRSVVKFGISVVTLVFQDDVDIYFARQQVFQKLVEAEKGLPQGVETEMGPVATAMGELYHYTLEGNRPTDEEGEKQYLAELRTVQDWLAAPMLKNVPGVTEVNAFGGYIKQFQVLVDPAKLMKYGISIPDVYETLQKNNENVGGSVIEKDFEQSIIRGIGLIGSAEDIGNIVLKAEHGTPVLVKDVAAISIGQNLRQGAALKNGKEAVGGIVMMLRGENTLEVIHNVQEKVREINDSNMLPAGIKIVPYYQRSEIIKNSIGTVTTALIEGALLVLLILFLFLRQIRGAFIVILALPLSLLLTFTVMKNAGLDANLMSLGGLAISIGMIIDATIIQVENVQRRLSEKNSGQHKLATVLKAVLEVRKPSIFGELIIALTFIPIISLQGMEGKMFTPLAFTVAIALLSSLLLSIFVIPVLCSFFLNAGPEKESLLLRAAKKIYLPALTWSMKNKWFIIGGASILLIITFILVPRLGTEFIPIMDEGAFDMDVQMLPGITLDRALETNKQIHHILLSSPELDTVVSRTGQSGIALEGKGVDMTGYTGSFKPRDQWRGNRSSEEIIDSLREKLDEIPGLAYGFSQPIQCRIDELVAGTRAQLIIKIFGEDMEVMKHKAAEIATILAGVRGTTDLIVERTTGQSYIDIQVDRARIARFGLSVNDVLSVIEIAVGGKVSTQIYEGSRFFDCVVRFPEAERNSIAKLGNIIIRGKQGEMLPLNQLAAIENVEGPVQISRENGQRRIGVEMNIKDRDIGSFVTEAKKKITDRVRLPGGYYLSWGGQFENQQRAMKRLLIIAPVVVGLILLLLFLTFGVLRLGFLVLFNLPFALIGGVFALYISGLYLSVPASVGFIVLFGVAVLNGLVLVSYIAQLRQEGMNLHDSIYNACRVRLRPVLMTASIAIFSLIPMIFATGPGSEIQKPLAVVVVGGLITSTLLTLLLLPTLYGWLEGAKVKIGPLSP